MTSLTFLAAGEVPAVKEVKIVRKILLLERFPLENHRRR
jgi:hypothetical protein